MAAAAVRHVALPPLLFFFAPPFLTFLPLFL